MVPEPSTAFFCPQSRAPDEDYLAGLHAFLSSTQHGRHLLEHVAALRTDRIWDIFAGARTDVRALRQGPRYVDMLRDWALDGISGPLAAARSGIVALPLLVILQVGQYLRYLDFHRLSHHDFLAAVRAGGGGLQGYCGGLPSAVAVACAADESQVVEHAAVAIRILLGVGAYGEAADDSDESGSTTLALRLKYEGQADHLTRRFPGTHVSAVTDPRSVSIVGPADQLDQLFRFASTQGLQVQKMDIRGKVHNPENAHIAAELAILCDETPGLRLPEASRLQVPVRSNRHGAKLTQGSLGKEIITTILASRCDWFALLGLVAEDLKQSQRSSHDFVLFGLADCVPMAPFLKQGLRATKTDAHTLIQRIREPRPQNLDGTGVSIFPDDAIAVIGASCRLPGASSLEELWNLLANGTDRHRELPKDRFDLHGSFRASQSGSFTRDRKFYGNFIEDVRRFDHAFFGVSAREAANMDPQQRILLELSYEALDAAGYLATHRREAADDVGCFIGASLVEYLDNASAHPPTAYTSTGTIRAFLCGRLSHFYGWSGPAEVIDTACSSSLVAINRACKAIQTGECRIALAGGVNAITGVNNFFDLGKAGFLSPTGQCKPFDASADGYCRSDGAGLVVLKRLKEAVLACDHILGVIPGVATNQGGLSASITVPDSNSQQALYRKVLKQAGLRPDQVTYVEAHGTGTQAGDPVEIDSIRSVFGSPCRRDRAYIGSVKGNIGHSETSAGVAGLLKALAMIKHGQLPPQASHRRLNPKIPPLEPDGLAIAHTLRSWDVPLRAVLVNSYGAAGSNAALICCEMPRRDAASASCRKGQDILLPLVLSASSPKSLVDNAHVLSGYLSRSPGNPRLEDVALTLNERRKRLEFVSTITARSIEDAVRHLGTFDGSGVSKPSPITKSLVLVFSGQSDNKIGLDRSFYDNFSSFRSHLDACDAELTKHGYASIIPALFQTTPLEDATTLQCGMFAVQYACARCWMDAGAKPDAIMGHSLGELTALAVSGALSLSDGIKLVAARASLIESKWGPEKGAMLALSCSLEDFQQLSSLLHRRTAPGSTMCGLELACYNAASSLVAVGTSDTIDAAEGLLKSEPSLRKINFRRLNTSHGFHSALTEPILVDLAAVSRTLEWKDPLIPLEFCTKQHISDIREYAVARHARDPVFFADAIRRIEDSLGSSVWLEAGIDSPIIGMARKASSQPGKHAFIAMKAREAKMPADAIANVVSSLGTGGVRATHWSFLPGEAAQEIRHVWLPPYQFEQSQHWLSNIDRAAEMQQALASLSLAPAADRQPVPQTQLITRKETAASQPGLNEFTVNTQSERFRKVVGGHAVRSRALCPASMYMECATMALQQLLGDSSVTNNSLVFEQVHFQNALGLDPPGAVILSLEQGVSDLSWNFAIRTTVVAEPHSKEISHGHGVISILANPMLDMFERLVTGPMDRMAKNEDAERLMSKRAYGLFARVVEYDNFFRGIRSIAMDGQEAIATVALPETQPNRRESTAWKVCDTVSVDAFIQVLGLLMNTSDMISGDEVTVMVGLDRAVISTACRMEDVASWNVYTKFATTGDRQPVGDVFVCSPQSKLVALLSGCRFANLPISKLERALDSANSGRSAERPETSRAAQVSSCASSSMPSGLQTPATDGSGPAAGDLDMALKCLVAEYTGASHSDVSGEAVLSDLGLDSLASIELAGELASKFGLEMSSTDLMMCTLDRLSRLLGAFDLSFLGANQSKSSTKASLGLAVLEENHAEPLGLQAKGRRQKFFEILADISGVRPEKISLDSTLADVGIDSLSSVDLKQELEDEFAARIDDQLMVQTVGELLARLGMPESTSIAGTECDEPGSTVQAVPVPGSQDMERPLNLPNPLQLLRESDVHFDDSAYQRGFLGYWAEVAPLQDELLLAYIVEGFSALGVDLRQIRCGEMVPQFSYLTHKYDKLVARLWEILKYHGIVSINNAGDRMRSSRAVDPRPSSELQAAFEKRFPAYQDEASLIGLTGPRLADCLSGKEDAVAIMFGNAASLRIMENFYGRSPMMSTMTEQLVIYLTSLLRGVTVSRPVRILEVGAGTGGTTGRLAEALERYGIAARYTFTDISASLVSKAKAKFKKYAWMEFSTFNLEKEVPEGFRNEFDVVISANCVHATTDRTASCRRLREALKPEGFMVLSEVTRIMDWYDVCFGLLDGWWLVEDGSAYPLQPAEAWMSTFAAAGFASASYSEGPTAEANSQQLLVACNSHWDAPRPTMEDGNVDGDTDGGVCQLETVVYKETNGIVIHADVFFPRQAPALPMPVALMIHGGGHMTLSRKAIRPAQTRHLISNGFLPVSIDYRLCPEVSLEDGPMADVCSAYGWVRTELPRMAAQRGLAVEGETVVVVGWSTGGHLAMSLGWTAERAGLPPPTAVLSLYGPVDFESGELDSKRLPWLPGRAMSLERIMAALPTTPITGYDDSAKGDDTNLGWVRAGDARSELVLALFKEGIGLPLLLDGLRGAASRLSADGGEKGSWLAAASAERVASISPLARLRAGQYKVPTYVIHGTADQVAPFAGAERFVRELGARGVEHGFLALQGVDHIHDLRLRPGSEAWAAQVEPGYEFLFRLAGRRKL